jgi:DNA-binding transcriptional LysR family regulator
MYERTWAPGFHDLMFGILLDAGIVPNVTQTVGEIPTLISLVHSRMGITIAPLSVVKHYSAASVVACEILDRIPMSEIGIAVSKRFRAAVGDNFRSFALKTLGHAGQSHATDCRGSDTRSRSHF